LCEDLQGLDNHWQTCAFRATIAYALQLLPLWILFLSPVLRRSLELDLGHGLAACRRAWLAKVYIL
jgi:hypothetical protein